MGLFNEPKQESVFHFGIDDTAKAYLLETARWTKFLAIIGFIFTGLLIAAAIAFGIARTSHSGIQVGAYVAGTIAGYILISISYVYPVVALFQFSRNIKRAMQEGDIHRFNIAMKHQRNMFRYLGVMTIVLIAVYGILVLLIAVGNNPLNL